MNAQPQQTQIMSSPTTHQINQSPHHYGVPTENGTTSEDSDGKCKRFIIIYMAFAIRKSYHFHFFLFFPFFYK